MNLIAAENLSFGYGPDRPVLAKLSFEVSQACMLGIAGPNGVGKSTLLNILAGLLRPSSGTVFVAGRDIRSYTSRELARKVAVVRQESVPPFGFSVAETVMMARLPWLGGMAFAGEEDRHAVKQAMEATDTLQLAERPLNWISGGERQRVFLARALAQNTPLLLLDEPTSFLDLKYQVNIFDLLKRMQMEKGRTVVAVMHDINLAAQYCDQMLLLCDDFTCIKGPTEQVLSLETVEKAFGVKGFSAKVGKESFFLPLGRLAKDAGERHLH
jgi:iron complex transport system ATP-binding protein